MSSRSIFPRDMKTARQSWSPKCSRPGRADRPELRPKRTHPNDNGRWKQGDIPAPHDLQLLDQGLTMTNETVSVNIDDVIGRHRLGAFQFGIIALCGLIALLDG